jgi:hypothetical protein
MRTRFLVIVSAVLFVVLVFVAVKHFFTSEKERVLKTLRVAETCLEKKDHIGFMKQLSMEYLDDYGHTWATLFYYAKSLLNQYEDIKISLSQVNVVIEGEGKEKRAIVRFIGEGRGKTLSGESVGEVGSFMVEMKKEGSKWKIVKLGENPYSFY